MAAIPMRNRDDPLAEAHGLRYNATSQVLHWLTALLVLAVMPLGWVGASLPSDPASSKGFIFLLHKSIGLTILVLMLARLLWRARHPAPPYPPGMLAASLQAVASLSHWLLYVVLLVMPISGFLLTSSGKPVSYFGLFDIPALPQNDALRNICGSIHLTTQWVLYVLLALHLLATAWHAAIQRDGIVLRMLPRPRTSL
jgi:cytochrome b561